MMVHKDSFLQSYENLLRKKESRLTRISICIVWLFILCHVWKLIPTVYELLYSEVKIWYVIIKVIESLGMILIVFTIKEIFSAHLRYFAKNYVIFLGKVTWFLELATTTLYCERHIINYLIPSDSVTLVILLCNFLKFKPFFQDGLELAQWPNWLTTIKHLSHTLIALNSAVNFLIYAIL